MSRICPEGCTCGRHRPLRVCRHCGAEFKPRWGTKHIYCTAECSAEARKEPFDAGFIAGTADDCWEWQRTRYQGSEYGRWGQRRAHVVAWEREHGPVPHGLCVLHHCDNPPCVNPSHLYVGTHADNARDRKLREREVRGTRVNTNKLSEDDVYAIRAAYAAGEAQAVLAKRFGVSQPMVGFIVTRKSWAWLPER